MTAAAPCAKCGTSVPKTALAWTSAGEVCGDCERAMQAAGASALPPPDASVAPNPFAMMPLLFFATVGATFVVGGIAIALGIVLGFQVSLRGSPVPATWEAAGGFFGSGVVSSVIAFGIARLMRKKS